MSGQPRIRKCTMHNKRTNSPVGTTTYQSLEPRRLLAADTTLYHSVLKDSLTPTTFSPTEIVTDNIVSTIDSATSLPLGFDPGESNRILIESPVADDFFKLEGLKAGDVLRMRSHAQHLRLYDGLDIENDRVLSVYWNGELNWVIETDGTYYIEKSASGIGTSGWPDTGEVLLALDRPTLESSPAGTKQILFLDFDGETVTNDLYTDKYFEPFSDFTSGWGLAGQEDQLITAIEAVVRENLVEDIQALGINPNFDLEIRNSRDHADPWGQPFVKRVVIGGSKDTTGVKLMALEKSSVGNLNTESTAIVSPDLMSRPADGSPNSWITLNAFIGPETNVLDMVATGVGNVVSNAVNRITAQGTPRSGLYFQNLGPTHGRLAMREFLGVGRDNVFGTADDVDYDVPRKHALAQSLTTSTRDGFFFTGLVGDDRELYFSNGTQEGTRVAADLAESGSGDVADLMLFDDQSVLFTGANANGERELFRSYGTQSSSFLISNLAGGLSADPQELTRVGDVVYFSAATSSGVRRLHQTEGTKATTFRIPGPAIVDPASLTVFGDKLAFVGTATDGDRQVFFLDPVTGQFTEQVGLKGEYTDPRDLTVVGDDLYLTAQSIEGERELYLYDPVLAGVKRIRNLYGSFNSDPQELTAVGDLLFFTASMQSGQRELHVSNGISRNTWRVRNLSGAVSLEPKWLTHHNDKLVFSGRLANGQREMITYEGWNVKGYSGVFRTINLGGAVSSKPSYLTVVGDEIVFSAIANNSVRTIFKTNGTLAGTSRVGATDGSSGTNPADIAIFGDGVVYSAGLDGERELFVSDLTLRGTNPINGNVNNWLAPENFLAMPPAFNPVVGTKDWGSFHFDTTRTSRLNQDAAEFSLKRDRLKLAEALSFDPVKLDLH